MKSKMTVDELVSLLRDAPGDAPVSIAGAEDDETLVVNILHARGGILVFLTNEKEKKDG